MGGVAAVLASKKLNMPITSIRSITLGRILETVSLISNVR